MKTTYEHFCFCFVKSFIFLGCPTFWFAYFVVMTSHPVPGGIGGGFMIPSSYFSYGVSQRGGEPPQERSWGTNLLQGKLKNNTCDALKLHSSDGSNEVHLDLEVFHC